jgi:hypothetical protein
MSVRIGGRSVTGSTGRQRCSGPMMASIMAIWMHTHQQPAGGGVAVFQQVGQPQP